MRIITILLFFCSFFLIENLQAQERCQMNAYMQELLANPDYAKHYEKRQKHFKKYNLENPTRALCNNPVILPMAVHFQSINNPDEACLIDLALSQIQVLNDDYHGTNADITNWIDNAAATFPGIEYAETCVEFCLATTNHPTGYGVQEGQYAVTFNQFNGDNNADWAGYINIFVRANTGVLGYSPLGGSGNGDGVVIDANAFGSGVGCGAISPNAPYDLGRTLTHELGHYLNLDHVWGGNGGCGNDDGISDTPNTDQPYFGCPAIGAATCGSPDMHMNYMDYVNDACMYVFSAGQATVMENYVASGIQNIVNNGLVACGPPADPTCDDGIQNQGETGIDCGGPCPAICPTCDDGIQNGDEDGIDCGGSFCDPCPCYATSATVTINLDDYPEETSWEITDENGAIIASGGTYPNEPDGSTVTQDVDLSSGCYTFTINDTYGDGICCNYGTGSYIVSADGCDELVSGGQFGFSESTTFCLTDPAEDTATACADGIDNDGDGLIDCDDPDCQAIAAGCATCGDGSSFADAVLEYAPACPANISLGDAMSAVGLSDSDGSANYVSLGEGGALMLAFVDNVLVNSGSADADLLVFEVDGDVEACMIELRPYDMATENALMAGGVMDADGDGYYEMGMVAGGSATLDIDAMISANAGDLVFDAVKIMDVDDGACMGTSAGADIDAICALSSVPCSTFYMDADSDGFGDDNTTADVCALTAPAGYVAIGGDCDDTNAAINPGAPEACNEIDDNCNAQTDEGLPAFTYYADADSDGFGDPSGVLNTCETSAPAGYVDNNDDCDDTDAIANPSNTEVCNGVDDNCDGQIDEGFTFTTYYEDNDSDGFGSSNPNNSISVCDETAPAGYTTNNDDCNDNDANINPNASETCNGTDDNCNNETDEGLATQTYYQDADNDGYGNADVSLDDCEQPNGYTLDNTDCDDNNSQVNPGQTEDPDNNIDDDCDGVGMVSTVDLQREELFTISPNPTQSFVSIESNVTGFINARLVNQVGQSVLETSFVLSNNRQNIYLDNIPAGVYYFVFNNKNGEHIGLNKLVVLK